MSDADEFDQLPVDNTDAPFSLDDEFAVIDVSPEPQGPLKGLKPLVDDFAFEAAKHKADMQVPGAALTRAKELATSTGFESMTRNEINQMGLGPHIIDLKRKGFSLQQIASQLQIGYEQVKTWWGIFESQSPGQRQVFAKVMVETSVYDIPSQLEKLNERLEKFVDRMEFENPELHLRGLGEITKMLKLIKDCAELMANQKRREEESKAFVEEINKCDQAECPRCKHTFTTGIRNRIQKRISQLKGSRGFLS
jgi:hypothetical protein